MNQCVIALAGILGVGKSTVLNQLNQSVDFQHLVASELISSERQNRSEAETAQDELRKGDIDDNQALLIAGFRRLSKAESPTVVMDGHTVIDTPSGVVPVGLEVFRSIGTTHMVMLVDEPNTILMRRKKDSTRNRPERSAQELANYQNASQIEGFCVCLNLGIPYLVLPTSRITDLENFLRSL